MPSQFVELVKMFADKSSIIKPSQLQEDAGILMTAIVGFKKAGMKGEALDTEIDKFMQTDESFKKAHRHVQARADLELGG